MLPNLSLVAYILASVSCIRAAPVLASTPSTTSRTSGSDDYQRNCKNLTLTVTASAVNKVIPSPAASSLSTQDGVNEFYARLPSLLSSSTNQARNGTYILAAVYCQPPGTENSNSSNSSTPLQILMHGSTYTKEYWDRGSWGTADPKYSWTRAMNHAGYATLAVDKLGNGASSHPDPVYDVQLPLQMETMHSLITQIKTPSSSPIPAHSSYILVGHSSGSIFVATLAQTHPTDIDAVILTGYPAGGANNKGGIPSYHYLPAAYNTTRFPASLNHGYLLMNSEFNRTSAFYYAGHYDPQIPHLDFLTEGAQPLGEGFNLGPATQPAFTGKVLVVTGTKDPAICGFTPVEECKYNTTRVVGVNANFENNAGFDYYMPPTGHDLNWHYSAPETYGIVVEKLGRLMGFGG